MVANNIFLESKERFKKQTSIPDNLINDAIDKACSTSDNKMITDNN